MNICTKKQHKCLGFCDKCKFLHLKPHITYQIIGFCMIRIILIRFQRYLMLKYKIDISNF